MSLAFLTTALENKNVQAFLHTIRMSECLTDDCYNFLFGSSVHNNIRFTDLSKHPDILEDFNGYKSDAAGAYQIMYATWCPIQKLYNLPDFSKQSQDIAAVELISMRNDLQNIMDGYFMETLLGTNRTWASLYKSPYGQPQHQLNDYINWYQSVGGSVNV